MELKLGKSTGEDGILNEYLKLGREELVPSLKYLFNTTLLPKLYKLFSKIQTRGLTRILDENQPPRQDGFRSGFSVTNHLQATKEVTEKAQAFNLKIYIAFIDYTKAVDYGKQTFVLQTLKNQ
jgi:hypothetical protein